MTVTIRVTKLQAEELEHRLQINAESRDLDPVDQLRVWGRVDGRTLIVDSVTDCLDDIDSIIAICDDMSDDPWDGPKYRAVGRSMRGLRDKIEEPALDDDGEVTIANIRGGAR